MKIRIFSDLHLEFMPKAYAADFVQQRLPGDHDDVVILAGDVTNADGLERALSLFGARYDNVVFVAGNHEFYGSSPLDLGRRLDGLGELRQCVPENVHILEMGTVRIGSLGPNGHRFLGCTLWFPPPMRGNPACMMDFQAIRGFAPWVYERNRQSVAWLRDNVRPGDVVITHHLPTPRSIHEKYAGSPLNDFFLCDVSEIIGKTRPALWVHGHTHESCDYRIGATRVVCNPYGYWGHEVNASFDPDKHVVLP